MTLSETRLARSGYLTRLDGCSFRTTVLHCAPLLAQQRKKLAHVAYPRREQPNLRIPLVLKRNKNKPIGEFDCLALTLRFSRNQRNRSGRSEPLRMSVGVISVEFRISRHGVPIIHAVGINCRGARKQAVFEIKLLRVGAAHACKQRTITMATVPYSHSIGMLLAQQPTETKRHNQQFKSEQHTIECAMITPLGCPLSAFFFHQPSPVHTA